MQGVRWRPHLLLTHAVPHRVSHFEEKKMLLLYCHDREPLTQDIGRYKRTSWERGGKTDSFRMRRYPGTNPFLIKYT
jgi:hypothetical protein